MNATICGLIDTLFKDTVDTVETRTMREELLNNCLEHYHDLLNRGLSETEAVDAVVESLNGMKEIIDEYPKKPEAAEKESFCSQGKAAEYAAPAEEPSSEVPTDRVFSAERIHTVRTNLRSNDITVSRAPDGMIHVRCDEPEQLICEEDNGQLTIRFDSQWRNFGKENGLKSDEVSVRGIFNFVGKVLNKVAADISTAGTHVYIDLPEQLADTIELNSMSGDIEVTDCAAYKITLHATSGDIHYEAPENGKILRMNASSASGDIRVSCNAEEADCSSISGDVEMDGTFTNVRMKSTSGDVELKGCARKAYMHTVSGRNEISLLNPDAEMIEATSTSGSVEIELPESTSSVHAVMKSVSGSTRCAFPDAGSGAALQIRANSVSGSVRIR